MLVFVGIDYASLTPLLLLNYNTDGHFNTDVSTLLRSSVLSGTYYWEVLPSFPVFWVCAVVPVVLLFYGRWVV